MDIIDYFWNSSQDEAIKELKAEVQTKAIEKGALVRQLQEENHELRIRIGVLIRLLIERGVFSADEFATLVQSTKASLGSSAPNRHVQR